MTALDVTGLTVTIAGAPVVVDVTLRVQPGECVALVGASGSGKTVTARAALGLSTTGARVHADRLEVADTDVRDLSERRWRTVRGRLVGYVGQEALGALDPLRPVGREVADALRLHTTLSARERVDRVRAALEAVGLDPALATDGRTADTLSGGMRQRALIAAATVGGPALLVADEPTTALDAGVAVTVMEQLRAAQRRGSGLLVITHDLGLVAGWADRVAVMDDGRIVEEGPTAAVLGQPVHRATRALVDAAGRGAAIVRRGAARTSGPASASASASGPATASTSASGPATASASASGPASASASASGPATASASASGPGPAGGSAPGRVGTPRTSVLLAADGLRRTYGGTPAVSDVSLSLSRGRVLGVVGASGSGKTTVARMLLGLEEPDAGTVTLDGGPWAPLPERDRRARRHRMAAVVQDPGATFDERWDVDRALVDALTGGSSARATGALVDRVEQALRQVGLDPAMRHRSPLTLSGGQRQRLAIARALATEPEVVVLDEPVTALDATVQDAVLGLLERLRDETGVAMVFVSHDLRAVRRMADEVLVVDAGVVVEHGSADAVFTSPGHPVTERLLRAAERLVAGPAT